MMRFPVAPLAVLLLIGLAAVGLGGCSQAEAKPLDVTYYYLPG